MAEKIPSTKKVKSKRKIIFAEIVSSLCWLYFIVKTFIFDFDYYLVSEYAPSFLWVLDLKFFFFLSLTAILVVFLKPTKDFFKLLSYIAIYPFILLFWRIPKILFRSKSWAGIFALIELSISFFKSFKTNVIFFASVSLSCLAITATASKYTLAFSMLLLFTYLIIHIVRRFKYAINPTALISIPKNSWDEMKKQLTIKDIDKYNDNGEINSDWIKKLKYTLIVNKIYYFLITKLNNFQKSSFSVIYSFLKLSCTFLLIILVFTFQNLALYKIDTASFGGSLQKNFATFFYYSFNSIFTNPINDFYPVSGYARALNSLEMLFGGLIVVILFFIISTICREKHTEQINTAITLCQTQVKNIEQMLQTEYKLNPEEAMQEIKKAEDALVKIIYFLISNS